MMRTFVRVHRDAAFLFFLMRPTRMLMSSVARPHPPKECKVTPPMLHAAMPVEAVTATASGADMYFLRSDLMISRRRTDLPVPGGVSAGR